MSLAENSQQQVRSSTQVRTCACASLWGYVWFLESSRELPLTSPVTVLYHTFLLLMSFWLPVQSHSFPCLSALTLSTQPSVSVHWLDLHVDPLWQLMENTCYEITDCGAARSATDFKLTQQHSSSPLPTADVHINLHPTCNWFNCVTCKSHYSQINSETNAKEVTVQEMRVNGKSKWN